MFSCLLLTLSLLAPQGSTVYVPDDHSTIQDALYAVVSGDTVIVRAGTYLEYELSYAGKDVLLRSESGAEQTIIDGMASGSVFEFHNGEGPGAVLDGFTVTNGIKWDGGGISITADSLGNPSSPTVQNCIIENNVGSGGGGGMAIAGGSQANIENCLIQNNTTTNYHGAGVVVFSSEPVFRNCTIRDNISAGSGGGFSVWNNDSVLTVRNSIMSGNFPTNIDRIGAPAIRVRYTLAAGDGLESWFGTGCVDADPLFTVGPRGNAYLSQIASGQTADSPCIDAGKPSTGVFGYTRTDHAPDFGIIDMGFHYTESNPLLLTSTGSPGGQMTFDVSNATPNMPIAYIYAFALGSHAVVNPFTGHTVVTGLDSWGFTVVTIVNANPSGNYSLSVLVPPSAHGVIHLQAGDAISERFSAVLSL